MTKLPFRDQTKIFIYKVPFTLDPFVDNLRDANGAGDALLAYSSAALFKKKSFETA